MSYILDALRRADAERERGAVPSLQSQQHTIADDDAASARPRTLVWAVVALSVTLLAVLAWNLFGAAPAPSRTSVEGVVSTAPAPLPALPAPALPTTPGATSARSGETAGPGQSLEPAPPRSGEPALPRSTEPSPARAPAAQRPRPIEPATPRPVEPATRSLDPSGPPPVATTRRANAPHVADAAPREGSARANAEGRIY